MNVLMTQAITVASMLIVPTLLVATTVFVTMAMMEMVFHVKVNWKSESDRKLISCKIMHSYSIW